MLQLTYNGSVRTIERQRRVTTHTLFENPMSNRFGDVKEKNSTSRRIRRYCWRSVFDNQSSDKVFQEITPEQFKNINKGSKFERDFELYLIAHNIKNYVREFKPIPGRQYRIDFSFPNKTGVELEGGCWSKSKMGHTSGSGYKANTQKYNLLLISGWKILRYVDMRQVREEFLRDYQLLMKVTI